MRIGIVAVVALVALVLVAQVSIGGALQSARPGIALSWSPYNAEARSSLAARIVGNDRSPDALRRASALAEDALRRDPTRVTALRTLAMAAEERGDQRSALRLIAEAQRLSRRDYLTQLWIIQFHGRRGNVEGMVRHFDIALRSSARNRAALVPLLVGATIDPSIVPPLRAQLVKRPPWSEDFISQLVARVPQPATTVALTRGLLDPASEDDRALIRILLERLSAAREYDLAWRVYSAAFPARTSGLMRNPGFETDEGFAPFDWSFQQEADLLAVRERGVTGGQGTAVRLIAFNSRSGEPVRQLVRLSPGSYRIRAVVGDVPTTVFDRPALRVTCAVRGNTAAYLNVRPASAGASRVQARFAIPANCPWQWVSVQIAGQGSQPEVSPWIDNIAIDRAS